MWAVLIATLHDRISVCKDIYRKFAFSKMVLNLMHNIRYLHIFIGRDLGEHSEQERFDQPSLAGHPVGQCQRLNVSYVKIMPNCYIKGHKNQLHLPTSHIQQLLS